LPQCREQGSEKYLPYSPSVTRPAKRDNKVLLI
jgi:hypothetical protein